MFFYNNGVHLNYRPMPNIILIVDDSKAMLLKASTILAKNGFEVIPTSQTLDVLEIAQEKHPNLIVLDVEMPGINGYRLCEMLKENEKTEDIPVIIITSRDDYLDRMKAFTVGAIDFVIKDLIDEELVQKVKKALEKK